MPVVRMPARSRPRPPGSTPGDAGGPHVGRPGREARHRYRSARPRAVVTRSSPSGRWRRSGTRQRSRPRPWSRVRQRSRPWPPGSTPGDAGDPHAGAIPAVRLAIDAGPHGPGRGHQVRPPGGAGGPELADGPGWRRSPGRAPGRCRRSRSGSGTALNSPTMPVRTARAGCHRVEPPGGGGGPELASGPGRGHLVRAPRAMLAIRTSARYRPRPRE